MLASLLAAAVLAAASGPAWSPDGKTVAFAATAAGRTDVYTIRADGSGLRNVTGDDTRTTLYSSAPAPHGEPAWSRDGRLAYVVPRGDYNRRAFEYWVANADGSGKHLVTTQPTDQAPSWSPDGTTLTMESFETIVAARVADGKETVVQVGAGDSIWSPVDRRIAVGANDKTGNNGDVYTVWGDGTHRRRLTTARGSDWPVAWSRDGKRIAFATQRHIFATNGRDHTLELYVMNSDGSRQHRVGTGQDADFGPRGNSLVYSDGTTVYVVGAGGRGRRALAAGTDPKWSPDGRWIAFAHAGVTNYSIELVHPDGSQLHTLVGAATLAR